ncbi:MAG: prefoldin subunit alpha [Candidatus Aenigmatarchaeota archaeon]
MADEKELQEKILAHRFIEARIEGLLKQRESLLQALMEVEETIRGIEELEKKNEDFLFSLGSQTYIPCKIVEKNKIIVEIGANVAIEKSLEEGKQILKKRKEELAKSIASIEATINQLSSGLKELGEEIRKMLEERKAD